MLASRNVCSFTIFHHLLRTKALSISSICSSMDSMSYPHQILASQHKSRRTGRSRCWSSRTPPRLLLLWLSTASRWKITTTWRPPTELQMVALKVFRSDGLKTISYHLLSKTRSTKRAWCPPWYLTRQTKLAWQISFQAWRTNK